MTIHFSVRLMKEADWNSCHVLKKWKIEEDPAGKFRWVHPTGSIIQEAESLYAAPERAITDSEIVPAIENAPNNETYELYLLDNWAEDTRNRKAPDQKEDRSLLMFLCYMTRLGKLAIQRQDPDRLMYLSTR
jgi:hypothetical protein